MKLNLSDFPRKCQFPLMIALGTLPAFAFIVLRCSPEALGALALLLPAYVLLAWLCMVLPGKIRVASGVLGCAALMLLGLHVLPVVQGFSSVDRSTVAVGKQAFSLLVPLMLCFFLLYGLQFSAWPREREIPFNWYAVGLGAHLLILLVVFIARRQGSTAWEPAMPLLTAAFVLFLLLALLSLNRSALAGASLGRQRVSPSIRRRNVVIITSILVGALIIAGIPAIAQLLSRTWTLFLRALGAATALLGRLLAVDQVPGAGSAGESAAMIPAAQYQEPGLLARILERVMLLAALLLAAVLLFLALRVLARNLRALLKGLRKRLMQFLAASSEDYVDEITDTREENPHSDSGLLKRLRQRLIPMDERRLSPNARIRHRYMRLLKKHPDWPQSRTARENLSSDVAVLYERARYSGQTLSPEDAERFSSGTKGM